ncbi:hypothetical protein NKG94_26145 [Micromonospora sp. M12]
MATNVFTVVNSNGTKARGGTVVKYGVGEYEVIFGHTVSAGAFLATLSLSGSCCIPPGGEVSVAPRLLTPTRSSCRPATRAVRRPTWASPCSPTHPDRTDIRPSRHVRGAGPVRVGPGPGLGESRSRDPTGPGPGPGRRVGRGGTPRSTLVLSSAGSLRSSPFARLIPVRGTPGRSGPHNPTFAEPVPGKQAP